jgi:hypothetical protein
MYNSAPIGRAIFLHALKQAAIQYVETKEQSLQLSNKEISDSGKTFLARMNPMIKPWRTYLASVVHKKLLLNNEKVDEFVEMVEHANKM